MPSATSAPDRAISSLAIIKVNFDRRRSFLENFSPFLRHCLARSEVDAVSAPDLQKGITDEFGLELPQAVVKTLLRREEREGRLRREHGTYVVLRDQLDDADLDAERTAAYRKQRALVDALIEYAAKEFDHKWDAAHAQRLLLAYLDAFSTTVLAAAVAGRTLPVRRKWTGDQYIVHKFVLDAVESDPTSFAFLEIVVKGKMLADAMYLAESEVQQGVPPLTKLEVYLDGPILLHLLGYAGPELAAPYLELVELLKAQGANVRCFTESVEEARHVLDAAAERVRVGNSKERFHGDVVGYLIRQGKSQSDIQLMSNRLEKDLLQAGVQTVDQPPVNIRLTTDETHFEQLLEQVIGYTNRKALTTDLDALTAIHRLRTGQPAKSLAKSKAVFVTRNFDLARVSAKFFQQRRSGPMVPNCVLDSAFTTVVWLHQPLAAPNLPKDRIIADAYAAMNPSDQLWRAFNDEIDKLRSSGKFSEEDSQILRRAQESKEALMDETLGDDDAYTEGTALQVLEQARERMRADLQEQLESERGEREAVEAKMSERSEALERNARKLGRVVARAIFVAVIPILALGLIFGPLGPLDDGWSPLPNFAQFFCTLVVFGLTAWSLWAGVTFRGLAKRATESGERVAVRGVERFSSNE